MSGLRVISGTAGGHRLRSVPGDATRPITDRAKESLFNILGGDIQGANFLDLFAGTGSVGIEALSRGAAFTRFVDQQRLAVETVRANLQSTRLAASAEIMRLDAFTLNLLSNDEVLAVDQDALGRPARRVATLGPIDIYGKELEDGSVAVGYFNRGDSAFTFTTKPERYGAGGRQRVRDLWRQRDLPDVNKELTLTVPPHGVQLYKFTTVR